MLAIRALAMPGRNSRPSAKQRKPEFTITKDSSSAPGVRASFLSEKSFSKNSQAKQIVETIVSRRMKPWEEMLERHDGRSADHHNGSSPDPVPLK
jgi:hypothetical protein